MLDLADASRLAPHSLYPQKGRITSTSLKHSHLASFLTFSVLAYLFFPLSLSTLRSRIYHDALTRNKKIDDTSSRFSFDAATIPS